VLLAAPHRRGIGCVRAHPRAAPVTRQSIACAPARAHYQLQAAFVVAGVTQDHLLEGRDGLYSAAWDGEQVAERQFALPHHSLGEPAEGHVVCHP
jgi:hypothetical protein